MNPIGIEDLFDPKLVGDLEAIIKALTSGLGEVSSRMEEVRESARKLASAPVSSGQAEETKKMANSAKALSDEYKELLKQYDLYAETLGQVTQVERDQNAILKLQAQYASSAEGSFNKLSAEYRLIKIAMNAMTQEADKQSESFKRLQKRAAELYDTMNEYQKSTGKFTMQVGDYSRALNGLQLSTQQILREMPTLANSVSQFFMAISNNVPIFVDNFKRAQQELGSFSAALKGTIASLLSWQTVLIVVLTVLPKIAKTLHNKAKAQDEDNKKMEEQINHLQQIHSALVAAQQAEATSVVKLRLLVDATQDLNRAESERIEAANTLKTIYKEQLENYSAEEIALGKAQIAIDNITASLKRQAQARALVNKLTELYTKQIEAEDKMLAASRTTLKSAPAGITSIGGLSRYMKESDISDQEAMKLLPGVNKEVIQLVHNYDEARKAVKEYGQAIEEISKKVDVLGLAEIPTGGGAGTSGGGKEQKVGEIPDYIIEYYDAVIAGMEDGLTKEMMQLDKEGLSIRRTRQKELDKLQKQEEIARANNDAATLAQIAKSTKRVEMIYEQGLENIRQRREALLSEESVQAEADPLAQVRKAYVNAISAMRQYSDTIQEGLDSGRKISQEELKDWQGVIKKKLLAEAEYQKAKKQLELQGRLDAKQISEDEYKDLLAIESAKIDAITTKAIDKLGKSKGKKWNIWTAIFGTDIKDETTGTISRVLGEDVKFALDQVSNTYKNATTYVNEYIDALARLAQQAVETANTEVENAQMVYEKELEAKANGYANSVDTARKEYEEKLKIKKKAQEEEAKIQRVQLAMESASQAANLITATTSIIKAYSSLPIVGQVLAIAGIATMWATFIAAKAKAASVTQYGEGMSEYLDYGGSHASGNDIDFGTTRDGRRRRVERGEVVGVISKRRVAKYGASRVTGIIDSLNRGDFEYKYANAFGTTWLTADSGKADLSRLEGGVNTLVKQGEYRETYQDGKRIIQYKNLRRVIR